MITALGMMAVLILIFLSILHFYWAFGGKWGLDSVLPTNTEGKKTLRPKGFATVLVGIVLGLFALLYLAKTMVVFISFFPDWVSKHGVYIIASIFIIRAIGDFKYVGFFKKIKNTKFARSDTKYFSPLCLFLGLAGLLLGIMN